MKYICLPFLLLGMTGLANADHCQQIQRVQSVVQAVSYQPVIQEIIIPAYFATYAPQALAASPDAQNLAAGDRLTEMEKRLERIEELLLKMQHGQGGNAQPMSEKVGALDVMKAKCGACHRAPSERGLGFTLLDGQGNMVQLNPKDKLRVFNRVSKNSMPPPESSIKLSEEDKKLIISLVK